jgi:hypothetical protein
MHWDSGDPAAPLIVKVPEADCRSMSMDCHASNKPFLAALLGGAHLVAETALALRARASARGFRCGSLTPRQSQAGSRRAVAASIS